MCKMEERSQLANDGESSQEHSALHQHFLEENGHFSSVQQNESILAVAQELAMAGDDLTRRFSKNDRREDTVWKNVKIYAFIVTFRLMLGLV